MPTNFDAAIAGTTLGEGVVTLALTDTFHTPAAGNVPTVAVDWFNNESTFGFGAIGNPANGNVSTTIDLLSTTR